MKLFLAILAYLLIGGVLGWGILLAVKGSFWLLIAAVVLIVGPPEILGVVVLTREEAGVMEPLVGGERHRESDPPVAAIRPACAPLEADRLE